MNPNPKKPARQTTTEAFMLGQPVYDLTPPQPTSHPKAFHYSLDPSRHYSHKFSPLFLADCKPLLIGCDVGIPVEELILFSDEYSQANSMNKARFLDDDDLMLLNQIYASEEELERVRKSVFEKKKELVKEKKEEEQ